MPVRRRRGLASPPARNFTGSLAPSGGRSEAAQRVWDRVYVTSVRVFTPIDEYEDADARKTAHVAVHGLFVGKRTPRILRGLPRMPDPGPVLDIGTWLELWFCDERGQMIRDSAPYGDRIRLLWSENLRACFVIPRLSETQCRFTPTPREDRLARIWAKGRAARCASLATFPAPPMPYCYPGLAITYSSDKFTHGRQQKYIHHFEPDVNCYFARDYQGAPRAIMVRGGKLRLTHHGLAG